MASLNQQANAVLQELGGVVPDVLYGFEDAKREYVYTRVLELQKLGVADTDKTVQIYELDVDEREGSLVIPSGMASVMPAFVEYAPTGATNTRLPVSIVPVEDVPNYEGGRAIAFYGTPWRYRLSWNSWENGTLYMGFDPVEDLTEVTGSTEMTFPLNFSIFLVKKTALKAIDTIRLKLVWLDRNEEKDRRDAIERVLDKLQVRLAADVAEWERELERWLNKDLNEQAYHRRSIEEIEARREETFVLPPFMFN